MSKFARTGLFGSGYAKDDIGRLTPPERIALIARLWDSLEQEQVPLAAQKQNLNTGCLPSIRTGAKAFRGMS